MELFGTSQFSSMVSSCIWQKDVTRYQYSYPKLFAVSNVFASRGSRRQSQVSSSESRVSDGYARAQTKRNYLARNTKFYRSLGSCLVALPPNGRKPHAIVKFLGGAFIGAIPEVFYSYFIKLLANEGFLVIAVPYNVTFDHAQAANDVYKSYTACLDLLSASGLPDMGLTARDFVDLPLYSVGHSNGALLQALTGSRFSEKIPEANVIISFNNRPASEAVPYFEQLGPLLCQIMPIVESSPLFPMTKTASDAGKVMLDIASAMVFNNDQEAFAKLMKFSDQLPVVIDQITKGVSEFKPNPSENRDLVLKSYNVKHTLLVKFNFDTIDDTDLLEASLRPRVDSIGGTIEKLSLAGTHLTPCMQGLNWRVGQLYTPTDAAAQVLRTTLLRDINILSSTVSRWLKRYAD